MILSSVHWHFPRPAPLWTRQRTAFLSSRAFYNPRPLKADGVPSKGFFLKCWLLHTVLIFEKNARGSELGYGLVAPCIHHHLFTEFITVVFAVTGHNNISHLHHCNCRKSDLSEKWEVTWSMTLPNPDLSASGRRTPTSCVLPKWTLTLFIIGKTTEYIRSLPQIWSCTIKFIFAKMYSALQKSCNSPENT